MAEKVRVLVEFKGRKERLVEERNYVSLERWAFSNGPDEGPGERWQTIAFLSKTVSGLSEDDILGDVSGDYDAGKRQKEYARACFVEALFRVFVRDYEIALPKTHVKGWD